METLAWNLKKEFISIAYEVDEINKGVLVAVMITYHCDTYDIRE